MKENKQMFLCQNLSQNTISTLIQRVCFVETGLYTCIRISHQFFILILQTAKGVVTTQSYY